MPKIKLKKRGFHVHLLSGRRLLHPWKVAAIPVATLSFFSIAILLFSHPTSFRYLYLLYDQWGQVSSNERLEIVKEVFDINKSTLQNLAHSSPPSVDSPLPSVRLDVGSNTLTDMKKVHDQFWIERTLEDIREASDKHWIAQRKVESTETEAHPYFKAILLDNSGNPIDIKMKLRGANHWHHNSTKPSLRMKVAKNQIADGWRYAELKRPKDALALTNWAPDFIGRNLGLISELGSHVRLFINRKYMGIYEQTRRQGEPLAIANHRMPGTFFKGESSAGLIWEGLDEWDIEGEQNDLSLARFQEFIKLVSGEPSIGSVVRLRELLDMEKMAAWAALHIAFASNHTDHFHNHSYFLNTNEGLIEPIPWDVMGAYYFSAEMPPDYDADNPIMRHLIRDPIFRHRRNQILRVICDQYFTDQGIPEWLEPKLSDLVPELKTDIHLQRLIFSPSQPRDGMTFLMPERPVPVTEIDHQVDMFKKWLTQRQSYIQDYLSDAFANLTQDGDGSKLEVFGNVGVLVECEGKPTRLCLPGLSMHQQKWNGANPYQNLERVPDVGHHIPAPMHYRFREGPNELTFRNAITGQIIQPNILPSIALENMCFHPSAFEKRPSQTFELGPGKVDLRKDFLVAENQSLLIHPGTTLRLAASVGIYSKGKVTAVGTESNPISIIKLDDEPWASIGVSGKSSKGTIFSHVEISGGSTGQHEGIMFKGMLSVYNCPEVDLTHCIIGANYIGDDSVNFAQSHVRIDHCEWSRARSDALDLDMCTGTISNSRWIDSGNDSIDLMNCRVYINNCFCTGSGDKGISVGEETEATIANTEITKCAIGIEAKDASKAYVVRSSLIGNLVGIHSYQKKWMFRGAGKLFLDSCVVSSDQGTAASIESRGDLRCMNTVMEGKIEGKSRISNIKETPNDWSQDLINKYNAYVGEEIAN